MVVFLSSLRSSGVVSSNYIGVLQDSPRRHLGSSVVNVVTVSSLSSLGIAPTMSLATYLTLRIAPGRRCVTQVVIDVMQGSHKAVTSRNRGR